MRTRQTTIRQERKPQDCPGASTPLIPNLFLNTSLIAVNLLLAVQVFRLRHEAAGTEFLGFILWPLSLGLTIFSVTELLMHVLMDSCASLRPHRLRLGMSVLALLSSILLLVL